MPDIPYIRLQLGGHRNGSPIRGFALIDAGDADLPLHGSIVGALRWSMNSAGYATRKKGPRGAQQDVLLHRVLLGLLPGDGLEGDHRNRDKLDCRRANLRTATSAQNRQNLSLASSNTSGFRGVSWGAKREKWRADARLNGRSRWLGYFATLAEAETAVVAWRREHMAYSEMDRDAAQELR